jgi:hypothetical protein
MYIKRNIEAPSCNYCCSGKPISITYSECVFVASVYAASNGHAPYYMVIRGLSTSTKFFHIVS